MLLPYYFHNTIPVHYKHIESIVSCLKRREGEREGGC